MCMSVGVSSSDVDAKELLPGASQAESLAWCSSASHGSTLPHEGINPECAIGPSRSPVHRWRIDGCDLAAQVKQTLRAVWIVNSQCRYCQNH